MNTPSLRHAAGLLTLCGAAACADPITDVAIDDWRPEVAVPLLETSFSLRDALEGSAFAEAIIEDSSGALRIGLTEELFDVPVGERFPLVPLHFPLYRPDSDFDFGDVAGLPITRLDLSDGTAVITVTNPYDEEARVIVTSDNFELDGFPLRRRLIVAPDATVADTFAAATAKFEVAADGAVSFRYVATLAGGREGVQLGASSFRLEPGRFEYAEGPLSTLGFELDVDSLRLGFFDALEPGAVRLVGPSATLTIDNSVGAPVRVRTPTSYFGFRDGTSDTLRSPLAEGIDVAYPGLGEGPVAKRSELRFDDGNSNLAELVSGLPNVFDFDFAGVVNPEALDQPFSLHREGRVTGTLAVDVPLALGFEGFRLSREFPLDGSRFDEATDVALLARVTNGFGLGLRLQATFYDAAGRELLEAFPEPIEVLRAASVDADGLPVAPRDTEVRVRLRASALAAISRASTVALTVTLDSPDGADGGADFTQLSYGNAVAVGLGAVVTLDGPAAVGRD